MKPMISLALSISVLFLGIFVFFEPQIAGAVSDSATVTQTVSEEISLSAPSDVSMSGAIAGMTGGAATGSTTWTVITNNNAGFKLELETSTSPALAGTTQGDSFADYTEAPDGTPDYNWTIAESDAEFGYTVEPATISDTDTTFLDNGSDTCGAGLNQTADKCWMGFNGSTKEQIISRSSETSASGEAEVVKFKAELNGPATDADGFLIEDTYQATITATATML